MSNIRESLIKVVDRFPKTRIAVIGDLILDEFIWGNVQRISPEAPVPVVEVIRESMVPGGAANVAMNLVALGAETRLAGLIGDDIAGQQLVEILNTAKVLNQHIVSDKDRKTTIKTRIIAHHQQVCRTDRESRDNPGNNTQMRLRDCACDAISESHSVILSDYAKGVFSDSLAGDLIDFAIGQNSFVAVDPKKSNFSTYRRASIITPNLKEVERACHSAIVDQKSLHSLGSKLRVAHNFDNLLVTMGEKGMALFSQDQISQIDTAAREVYDVTGAGDTVIAILTLAVAAGASLLEAAYLANHAAGVVVGKLGTATLTTGELIESLKR